MHATPRPLHKTLQEAENRVRPIAAGHYAAGKGQNYPAHYHHALEMMLFESGHIQCVLSQRAFDLPLEVIHVDNHTQTVEVSWKPPEGRTAINTKPGMVLVVPPGMVHMDLAKTAYSHRYVLLELPDDVLAPDAPVVFSDNLDRQLEGLFKNLVIEWNGEQPGRDQMLGLLIAQLTVVTQRLEASSALSAAERIVARAERLLEENLMQQLGIADLADGLNVSSSALRAYFARLRGCSPKEHQRRLRIRRALELISSSNLSLESVATMSGYDSASHLSRHVKAETGLAPGKFRRRDD